MSSYGRPAGRERRLRQPIFQAISTRDAGAPTSDHARRCRAGARIRFVEAGKRAASIARARLLGEPGGMGLVTPSRPCLPDGFGLIVPDLPRVRREREPPPAAAIATTSTLSRSLSSISLHRGRRPRARIALRACDGGGRRVDARSCSCGRGRQAGPRQPARVPTTAGRSSRVAGMPLPRATPVQAALWPGLVSQPVPRKERPDANRGVDAPGRSPLRPVRRAGGARGRLRDDAGHARHAIPDGKRPSGDGPHARRLGAREPRSSPLEHGRPLLRELGGARFRGCSTAARHRPKRCLWSSPNAVAAFLTVGERA